MHINLAQVVPGIAIVLAVYVVSVVIVGLYFALYWRFRRRRLIRLAEVQLVRRAPGELGQVPSTGTGNAGNFSQGLVPN